MRVDRLAVGCAVAAVLVVLAAAAEGLTTPSGRRSAPPDVVMPTPTPTQTPPPLEVLPEAPPQDLPSWLGPALAVAGALAVLAVVVLVVVWLRRLWQRRASRAEALEALDETAGDVDGALAAPVVRRGIARSLELLDDPRDLDDAVVRAWLGLEETAEDAGVARTPAETPTEFTTRLLARVPADRAAVDVLRALYSRARFGGAGGRRDDDAERARAALRALAGSWDAASTGPGRAPERAHER
ncbi:DUF4129 domain-containing protein [Quadrisphaera sp. INWT6]|uniref:DUF4129 domain-containing protein n=1 Tax=Quadrisphaera sp. INWT6 TaxID=2596917 RepID=UPI001891F863|nr:DUF4129 domain-containing protein [Quadrisphaera sp. INWT6]MBF5080742.1 DUF4129 domain-containing protein [Quadrisphaera sp. INWT6]